MVAITGANGLLGNFILNKFIFEKIPVIGLQRIQRDMAGLNGTAHNVVWREADVINGLALTEALKGASTVIHAAAVVSFDPGATRRIFQTNVTGTQNVVNACLALGIPRLIFISSVAALGRKKGVHKINEETKWIDSDLNSDYAKSKYLAELEVHRGQEEGLSVSIINPSVILATADPNKSSAQIFRYVQREQLFYADGTINYVDVRDVAEMIYKVYLNPESGEKYVANAGAVGLKELMTKIALRLGKRGPSIKIPPSLLQAAAWLEEMRCKFTGGEVMVSRQSARMPGAEFLYENQKSIDRLNMTYRPLDETLDWCCDYYRRAFTTNKQK